MCIWKRCLHPFRTSVAVLPLGILHVHQHLGFCLNHQVDFELQRLLNFGDAAANCGSERNLHSYLWVWAPLLGFFFYFRCGKGYNKLFMETAKKGRSIQESPARGIFFFGAPSMGWHVAVKGRYETGTVAGKMSCVQERAGTGACPYETVLLAGKMSCVQERTVGANPRVCPGFWDRCSPLRLC